MKLLFICTHNRCRSILAEAITNHVAGDKITAVSAGSSPQGAVHPLTLKYLQEHQIPTDGLTSQSWDEFEDFNPDAVLTLCDSAAQEACPVWFGKSLKVHWGLEDPSKLVNEKVNAAHQRRAFSHTISVLKRRVQRLVNLDIESLSPNQLQDVLRDIAQRIN